MLSRLVASLCLFPSAIFAADIEVYRVTKDPQTPVFVFIRGLIEAGDAVAFEDATDGIPKVTVILESPGGSVDEALRIGAHLRLADYATMVLADHECYSACALIWVASERRYMSASSIIGVHAAYRVVGDELQEVGSANAEIGSYLTYAGLRREAIRFFTMAAPDDIKILTPKNARSLGIDIYLQDGEHVIPPWELPSVDRMAHKRAGLFYAGIMCEDILDPLPGTWDHVQIIDDEATSMVGDFWFELWIRETDRYKPRGDQFTLAHACIDAEAVSRAYGYELILGPSFDCAHAETSTEIAICADLDLAVLDRLMTNMYHYLLAADNPLLSRDGLRSYQIEWLAERNACGGDPSCIDAQYRSIIDAYGPIHFDTLLREKR